MNHGETRQGIPGKQSDILFTMSIKGGGSDRYGMLCLLRINTAHTKTIIAHVSSVFGLI